MIKGTIQIHPYGDESRQFSIADITIINDMTCTVDGYGNYEYRLGEFHPLEGSQSYSGKLTHFNRSKSVLSLLKKILNEIPEL